jgi:DNA-binding protein HU-beta
MNKAQLVARMAEEAEMAVTQSAKMLDAILDGIKEALTDGDTVSFAGLGSFGVRGRAARKVRNPQTGVEMEIEAATVPYFKAGKGLKEEISKEETK